MESDSIITVLDGHLWDEAMKVLKKAPSRARVRRPKDGKNVLQVAILNNAPEKVCLRILQVHPGAAKYKCKKKSLPIHDLCSQAQGSLLVLEELIKIFPGSLSSLDGGGDIPLHTAIKWNVPVQFIKLLVRYDPKSLRHLDAKQNNSIHLAISHCVSFDTIKFLIESDPANDHKVSDLQKIFFPKWNKSVKRTIMDQMVLRGVTPGGEYDTHVKVEWAEFYKRQDNDRRKMRMEDPDGWYPDVKKNSKYAIADSSAPEEPGKSQDATRQEQKSEDKKLESPLHLSCRHGHIGIVKMLLVADEKNEYSSVLEVNDNNDTALHLAAMEGHENCVKELLNTRVCDLNVQNKQEETAESLAELNEWRGVLKLFTRYKQVGWLA